MAASQIPKTMKKMILTSFSTDFKKATEIQEVKVENPKEKELLVKTKFVGVNASVINFTAGRYDPSWKPPLDMGFEGMGEVVEAGSEARAKKGDIVIYMNRGSFSEYTIVPDAVAIVVPKADPAYIGLFGSGLTAAISLGEEGDLKEGKTVLVTAAAGGTGQFAVQLAKQAGCHVIGTCSTDEKVEFLKSLKCDRVINYKKESFDKVLSEEYKDGIDVVYESVGKDFFNTALNNLAVKGRILVIGFISTYHEDLGDAYNSGINIPLICLRKNARVQGFMLHKYIDLYPTYLAKLTKMFQTGEIKASVDVYDKKGLESVADGVGYLYSGKSLGKVVVEF